jgi:hypothetical protein
MSTPGLAAFTEAQRAQPDAAIETLHKQLVPRSIENGTGILLNRSPGLLLIDNSEHQQLFHARTCLFDTFSRHTGEITDTPMYAFNEVGLLHYIDTLDERRGVHDRDSAEQADVAAFMAQERL